MIMQVNHGLHSEEIERLVLNDVHMLFLFVLALVLLLRHVLDDNIVFDLQEI